ncbi:hypothetical protein FCV25MIE_27125 [Fagus crenata]
MGWVLVGEGGGAKEEDEGIGLGKEGSGKAGGMMGSLGSMGSVSVCGKGLNGLWAVCGVLDNERGLDGLGVCGEIVEGCGPKMDGLVNRDEG